MSGFLPSTGCRRRASLVTARSASDEAMTICYTSPGTVAGARCARELSGDGAAADLFCVST